jgi:hypothetical protein
MTIEMVQKTAKNEDEGARGDGMASKKDRYRIHRGEPGCNVMIKIFNPKKDLCQGRATGERPKKRYTSRLGQLWMPFLYNSSRVEDRIQEGCSKLRELDIRGEWPLRLSGGDVDFLANLFSSSFRMELPKHRRRSLRSFSSPIASSQLTQERRSRFSIRLYLLWLNFSLIPTRILYTLRRSFQAPYRESIITDRDPGQ